jgi:hypothetical protein
MGAGLVAWRRRESLHRRLVATSRWAKTLFQAAVGDDERSVGSYEKTFAVDRRGKMLKSPPSMPFSFMAEQSKHKRRLVQRVGNNKALFLPVSVAAANQYRSAHRPL